jgi:5-enolpyruvylshikimate-3-phosphate synthase
MRTPNLRTTVSLENDLSRASFFLLVAHVNNSRKVTLQSSTEFRFQNMKVPEQFEGSHFQDLQVLSDSTPKSPMNVKPRMQ